MTTTTYSIGTITVGANSTSVAGSGTAWLTSGLRAGDLFIAAGDAVLIASINSNTSMTLARPWPGAALSAANYDVLILDDQVRSLMATNDLLQKLTGGNLMSLGNLAGAANKLPYFSGPGAMTLTDLTSQARGLLSGTALTRSGSNYLIGGEAIWHGGNLNPMRANVRNDTTGEIRISNPEGFDTNPATSAMAGIALTPFAYVSAYRTSGPSFYFGRGTDGPLGVFTRGGAQVGTINVTASSTSYNTSSDYRLKQGDQPISDAAERLMQLRPISYEWINDPGARVDGFFAHEVQIVVPEAVTGTKDGMRQEPILDEEGVETGETRSVPDYQGIDHSKLVPLLTAALQDAISAIERLQAQTVGLAVRITALEARDA